MRKSLIVFIMTTLLATTPAVWAQGRGSGHGGRGPRGGQGHHMCPNPPCQQQSGQAGQQTEERKQQQQQDRDRTEEQRQKQERIHQPQ